MINPNFLGYKQVFFMGFNRVFLLLSIILSAQCLAQQNKLLEENNSQENYSNINNRGTALSLNDSVYHAGALLFMDLEMDLNNLKSTFCLSCHDGLTASLGHSSSNIGNPMNLSKMEAVLNFDHPVAFEYTKELALSNNRLKNPLSYSPNLKGTISEVLLVNGSVECVTCHNIFFKTEKKERFDILNESVGTLLCLECHKI